MLAALKDYLPLGDLVKILAVCLVVAVIAPSGVSLAIAGLDQRTSGRANVRATAMIVAGVAVLALLIAAGIYALFTD